LPVPQGAACGFTLIEMMAALAVFVILTAIAGGAYSTWRKDTRVDAAKEVIVSILQQARLRALSRRVSQSVSFDYNANTVSFDYNGDGTIQAGAETQQFPTVNLQDFVCGTCSTGANQTETITFTPRGTSNTLTVRVSSAGTGKTFYVVVNGITGRVDIRRTCAGGTCK